MAAMHAGSPLNARDDTLIPERYDASIIVEPKGYMKWETCRNHKLTKVLLSLLIFNFSPST